MHILLTFHAYSLRCQPGGAIRLYRIIDQQIFPLEESCDHCLFAMWLTFLRNSHETRRPIEPMENLSGKKCIQRSKCIC